MADCDDPTVGERISLTLIPVGCWLMEKSRGVRQPGATLFAILAGAFLVVSAARGLTLFDKSWWQPAGPGERLFVALSAAAGISALIVSVMYKRLLRRYHRRSQFEAAALAFSRLVSGTTSIQPAEVGVNIWLIKGPRGFRRLIRAGSVSEPRHPTPITWTKGKGIIGEAWERDTIRFADLDVVRAITPTEADWCSLPREERFRLSWAEFDETTRYHAVLAVPLRRLRFGVYRVRGVAAIDLLTAGKAAELNQIHVTPEFSAIRRTCEAAFAGDQAPAP